MQTDRRWILPIALALVAAFVQAAPVHAEEPAGEPAPARTIDLGIRDVIVKALENNLDIKVERYNPGIADADIMTATGEFDPTLRLEYGYEEDTQR